MQSAEARSLRRCSAAAQRSLPIGWRTHWVSMPAKNVGHICPGVGGEEGMRRTTAADEEGRIRTPPK